jgi:hypothetical protein
MSRQCLLDQLIFAPPARVIFREAKALNAAAWERGRGWAFEIPLGGLHYYELSNTTFHRLALRTLERLVADDGAGVPRRGELARVGPTGFNGVLSDSRPCCRDGTSDGAWKGTIDQ